MVSHKKIIFVFSYIQCKFDIYLLQQKIGGICGDVNICDTQIVPYIHCMPIHMMQYVYSLQYVYSKVYFMCCMPKHHVHVQVICGIPLLYMELAVGQYTRRGPVQAIGKVSTPGGDQSRPQERSVYQEGTRPDHRKGQYTRRGPVQAIGKVSSPEVTSPGQ